MSVNATSLVMFTIRVLSNANSSEGRGSDAKETQETMFQETMFVSTKAGGDNLSDDGFRRLLTGRF